MRRAVHVLILLVLSMLVPSLARAQGTETVIYYHTDAVGSVRMTTDANGQVLQRYDYLPFGEPWPATPLLSETQRFGGHEFDAETQLNYFGARHQLPQTGRFTQADLPGIDQTVLDPQSWNLYTYVRNNPLKFIDPDGRACVNGFNAESGAFCGGVTVVFPQDDPTSKLLSLMRWWDFERAQNIASGTPDRFREPIREAHSEASKRLQENKCSAFYGGKGIETLNSTNYRFNPFTNQPDVAAGILNKTMVNINPTGPFFTGPPKTVMYGRVWTPKDFRGFILLHELGHQLDTITGFKDDYNDRRLNEAQSQRVVKACY